MEFKVGDKVKLNKRKKSFIFGQGGVTYEEIGEIVKKKEEVLIINFPDFYHWKGLVQEVVLAERKEFFKKLPNDYTGTIEIENGYIVEKEILDEEEKEYLSAIIKPFKNRVRSIEKTKAYREYVYILLNDASISLPYFKSGTMYKGMELDKKYTLKELGLDEQ